MKRLMPAKPGMDAKVAIGEAEEVPVFQVADDGLAADVFRALPALEQVQ